MLLFFPQNQDDARDIDENISSVSTGRSSSLSHPSASSTPKQNPRTNRKKKSDFDKKREQFLDVATTVLGNQNKFRAFGNNVAYQLEEMNRHQQVIAE